MSLGEWPEADAARWRRNRREELDSAELYRRLAAAEEDEALGGVYRRLAELEERHAEVWAGHLLRAIGGEAASGMPGPALARMEGRHRAAS